jgi:hypothetical protein
VLRGGIAVDGVAADHRSGGRRPRRGAPPILRVFPSGHPSRAIRASRGLAPARSPLACASSARSSTAVTYRSEEDIIGSVDSAHLYINGSDDDRVPIVLPQDDPSVPISANTRVRARVTLSADEIAAIGENGTYYDLRIRLWEEDNSSWPWGDDNDDQIWQRRRTLQAIAVQSVAVSVDVLTPTLKEYGAEYYAGVKLYRRTNSGMSSVDSRRTNTIKLDFTHS